MALSEIRNGTGNIAFACQRKTVFLQLWKAKYSVLVLTTNGITKTSRWRIRNAPLVQLPALL